MKCSKEKIDELRDRILKFRAKNNLSQADFANLCKISYMTESSIENGRIVRLNALTVAKIENILENIK